MNRRGVCRDGRPGDGRTGQREVIKTADWILDLGPEGGDKGGVVAEGAAEDVAEVKRSYTGRYLAEILARSERAKAGSAIKLTKARTRVPKREREAAE